MATYKLIQDIEAEDKIIGPLTLRQFIFALIGAFFGYLSFMVTSKGLPFLLILFLPPTIFFAFFAFPFGRDQPTEIWFLAKLRFWLLPRKRLWDQSGVKELVTITVPKKVEQVLTDGLSQSEVKSRLQGLANTLDSRGWAVKNIGAIGQSTALAPGADRLIDLGSVPQDVPSDNVSSYDDMLDTVNNPLAHQVDAMVTQSAQAHRQKLLEEMGKIDQISGNSSNGGWFMGQGGGSVQPSASGPAPVPPRSPLPVPTPEDEAKLSKELKQKSSSRQVAYGHMKTLDPTGSQRQDAQKATVPAPSTSRDDQPDNKNAATIATLASNDDLNVATIAREVHKAKGDNKSPDEVVISLH